MQADHAVSDAPPSPSESHRFGHHRNAFGALRLLFASLVIVAHVPAFIDGDGRREFLTWLTGTISFGELAVSGFFIISGYLVTGSYLRSTPRPYLVKRIARICPAFIVAFWICVLIVAPLGGATLTLERLLKSILYCLAFADPLMPGVFAGTHYRALDGSMWTIAYEVRCCLLLLVLGLAGVLRRRAVLLAVTIVALSLSVIFAGTEVKISHSRVVEKLLAYGTGGLSGNLWLVSTFLTGACFYLYRDRTRVTPAALLVATIGLVAGMVTPPFVNAAMAVFGGYLIIAAARSQGWPSRINNENDISYGVYLYAWPITKLLLWWWPRMHPVPVVLLTFAGACVCGWASWVLIERPVMQWARRSRPARACRAG